MKNKNHVPLRKILSAVNSAMRAYGNDCLIPKYKEQKQNTDHYSFGLCYVASEAVFYLSKEFNDLNLKPCVGRIENNTHWWLENKDTGKIIDPTKSQFKSDSICKSIYSTGRGNGFLTKQPSRRAQILINHAKAILK